MDVVLKMFGKVLRNLRENNLPLALDMLLDYARKNPFVLFTEELLGINESFQLMLHYMESGADDPTREKMYLEMVERTNKVARNMLAEYRRRNVDFYRSVNSRVSKDAYSSEKSIRMVLESFVGDIAMLDLESEEKRGEERKKIYSRHFSFMQSLFCSIVVSDMWTSRQADSMTEIMLLPTVDSADIQLIVSALMLAVMNNFDINKFKVLVDVYQKSRDENVRQKALIGWALSVTNRADVDRQKKIVGELCQNPDVLRELLELQKQVTFCMNAERDNDFIQRDIMPTLIKNSNFEITRLGISEKEVDPMHDILDPGAEDKAMDEVEEKFQQMMDLQKSGADVYFGGFSQMKRFPFFYSLVNWFVPFNINHPDLSHRLSNAENVKFLERMLGNGLFCDSDKYSFALAMSSVFDKLPASVKEMISRGDYPMGRADDGNAKSPAYIRRQALQDLYRFFRLYDKHEQIYNPFSEKNFMFLGCRIFDYSSFRHGILSLGYFLMTKKTNALLDKVVSLLNSNVEAETADGRSAIILSAAYELKYVQSYENVCRLLDMVREKEPDNSKVLSMYARAALLCGKYEESKAVYEQLFGQVVPKKTWQLSYAIVLTKLKLYDKASKVLFQLDFECPDTPNVKRALAWTLLWQDKLTQASREYEWLVSQTETTARDSLNAGYCCWFRHEVAKATDCFLAYVIKSESEKNSSEKYTLDDVSKMLHAEFNEDNALLKQYGIKEIDRTLAETIVYNKYKETNK